MRFGSANPVHFTPHMGLYVIQSRVSSRKQASRIFSFLDGLGLNCHSILLKFTGTPLPYLFRRQHSR